MKKTIIIFMLLIAMVSYSQNRYSTQTPSSYTPMTTSEIMSVPMALKAKYDENQKILYQLKKWILELKTTIKTEPFLSRLDEEYSVLTSMEDDDLARATKSLNEREIRITEIITEYSLFVSKQNSQIQTTQNSSENQKSQTNDVKNFWKKGFESYENKDYPNAIQCFSKALEIEPENSEILFARALSKSDFGDIYGALSDYEKILSMEGKITPIYYKFSTVYNNKAYCCKFQ